ncbi:MAG: hypothetical protein ABSD02_03055 [Steroidobacteraceae bacterium]|jgi:hypothetical protein
MRVSLLSICAFVATFGLAGLAPAAASPAGHGGGAGAHGGGGHAGSAAHEGTGHSTDRLGSRIPSNGLVVEAYKATIDGHDATVAVIHRSPLTATERDQLYRYHFKGFNDCAGHRACAGQVKAGEEMYCRPARNVAITSDLECLSFRPSK